MRTDARQLLDSAFGPGEVCRVAAPGRVNLIGEHIDYHGLAVLPMALKRRIYLAFRPRANRRIRAVSDGYGTREFEWEAQLSPAPAGDWENYLRAAAEAVRQKWGLGLGIDAAVVSDLPAAAGLSSSSALLVAFTLALLRANGIRATFEELMEVLPEGEHFVGTRGGGMDHAVSLAAREGCALLVNFEPVSVRAVPIPEDWGFLVAHSGRTAEKSGAVREEYNARRRAGTEGLREAGFASYREAVAAVAAMDRRNRLSHLNPAFMHVRGEALRVAGAVEAMERRDAAAFGRLLLESHASLRDLLKVSCPELDRLVDAAMEAGAMGARLTGAGFGGCAVVFAAKRDLPAIGERLAQEFTIIDAEPGAGALSLEKS